MTNCMYSKNPYSANLIIFLIFFKIVPSGVFIMIMQFIVFFSRTYSNFIKISVVNETIDDEQAAHNDLKNKKNYQIWKSFL